MRSPFAAGIAAAMVATAPADAATITFVQDAFFAAARADACRTPVDAASNPVGPQECSSEFQSFAGALVGSTPIDWTLNNGPATGRASASWDPVTLTARASVSSQLLAPGGDETVPVIRPCGDGLCATVGTGVGRYDWRARILVADGSASVSGRYSALFDIVDPGDPSWSLERRPIGLAEPLVEYSGTLLAGREYLITSSGFSRNHWPGSRFSGVGAFSLDFEGVERVAVPEPATLALCAVGLLGVVVARRRAA